MPTLHSIHRRPMLAAALSLASAVIAQPAHAQSSAAADAGPPDSIVARVAALAQGGDARERGAFLARALTPQARTDDSARIDHMLARLGELGAPYTLGEQKRDGQFVLATLRSGRTGRAVTLLVAAERGQPGRLRMIDVLEAHPAVLDSITWPAAPLADAGAIASTIRDNVGRLAAAGAFSGVVYVARGDSVLFEQGYGLADREDSTANTPRTRFMTASMGKMFTATAILQLVQAGKLRLDDTLARVLPAYPNADRARKITIRHLLEHTAGLGDLWSTPRVPVPGLAGQLAAAAEVSSPPLMFEPGTRWSYSNEGYVVLGAVVEQVSGETLQDYFRRHIFAPAGMTETSLDGAPDDVVPHRAVGYRPQDDDPLGVLPPRANWSFLRPGGASGAGGAYSTAADLARFGRALREGTLLSPALRDSMWTGRWDIPGYDGQRYGWGSFVWPVGGRTAVGHGGGGTGSGVATDFRHFTDGSYTVVVLTNIDPPAANRVSEALVRFLAVQPGPAVPH